MLEFALITPLIILLLAGAVNFGSQFYVYYNITNAARDGARIVALNGGTVQQGIDLVKQDLAHFNTEFTIKITVPPEGSTNRDVVVRISVPASVFSLFPMGAITSGMIETEVTMRKEGD
jgi:Flp pilus assembly protein TadG